jgi:hypothetical protein
MITRPVGHISRSKPDVRLSFVVGDHGALNVAVYGLWTDGQHAGEFLSRQQPFTLRELIQDVRAAFGYRRWGRSTQISGSPEGFVTQFVAGDVVSRLTASSTFQTTFASPKPSNTLNQIGFVHSPSLQQGIPEYRTPIASESPLSPWQVTQPWTFTEQGDASLRISHWRVRNVLHEMRH